MFNLIFMLKLQLFHSALLNCFNLTNATYTMHTTHATNFQMQWTDKQSNQNSQNTVIYVQNSYCNLSVFTYFFLEGVIPQLKLVII